MVSSAHLDHLPVVAGRMPHDIAQSTGKTSQHIRKCQSLGCQLTGPLLKSAGNIHLSHWSSELNKIKQINPPHIESGSREMAEDTMLNIFRNLQNVEFYSVSLAWGVCMCVVVVVCCILGAVEVLRIELRALALPQS